MSSPMNALHINELEQSLDAARRLQVQGQGELAAKAYLQAKVMLLELARSTRQPALKRQRLAQAERIGQLAKQAETIHVQPKDAEPRPDKRATTVRASNEDEGATAFQAQRVDKSQGFDCVAGLEDAKREIRLRMVLPFAHADMARTFKVDTGGGLLFFGPPGTGKTLLARATAAELDAAFFSIKASDIMSKWVGEAEKNVEALFAAARSEPRSVIFIDEIEALVPARSGNGSTIMARVVPQFLAEMQGFSQHAGTLLVMGATNEPWAIDPAMMRPGRFDLHIYVGLPDQDARRYQLERLLRGRPLASDIDYERLAVLTDKYSGADIASIVQRAAREAFELSIGDGTVRPLDMPTIETLIKTSRPSVSAAQLARYRPFCDNSAGTT